MFNFTCVFKVSQITLVAARLGQFCETLKTRVKLNTNFTRPHAITYTYVFMLRRDQLATWLKIYCWKYSSRPLTFQWQVSRKLSSVLSWVYRRCLQFPWTGEIQNNLSCLRIYHVIYQRDKHISRHTILNLIIYIIPNFSVQWYNQFVQW